MFLIPNEKIDDDETFDILFKIKNNVTLTLEYEKKDDDDNGFPIWAIIIIIVCIVLIVAVIIIIIVIKKKKSKINISEENKENEALINSRESQ